MIVPTLMFAVTAAKPPDPPIAYVKPQVAAEQLKACGFAHVSVRHDGELQEDLLVVTGIGQASGEQLRCAAEVSLSSMTYVEFPEPVNRTYQQLYSRMEQDKDRRDARARLERRGLLAKLPIYVKGETDDLEFARKLEALCGPKATGAFVRDRGIMTMKTGTIEHPALNEETFMCLMNVSSAAGFPWGFVGNEYYEKK